MNPNLNKAKKLEMVNEIKQTFQEELKQMPEVGTYWYIQRFLIATNWNLEKGTEKFGKFLKWREEKDISRVVRIDFQKT